MKRDTMVRLVTDVLLRSGFKHDRDLKDGLSIWDKGRTQVSFIRWTSDRMKWDYVVVTVARTGWSRVLVVRTSAKELRKVLKQADKRVDPTPYVRGPAGSY